MKSIKKQIHKKYNKTKKIKLLKGSGNTYQEQLQELINENNIEKGNYSLTFPNKKTLNFNVNFNSITNLTDYILKSIKFAYPGLNINKDNITELFNQIDIFQFIDQKIQEIDTNKLISRRDNNENPAINVLSSIIFLLNREITSNTVHLNGENLINNKETYKNDDTSFVLKSYKNLLEKIKEILPTITNVQLFYILFFLTASGEEVLGFFTMFNIELTNKISEVGNTTFTASSEEKNNTTDIITYITNYQQSINKLFKLPNINYSSAGEPLDEDNPRRTIFDYIYNYFDHYIKIVKGEIIVTTYRVYFLIIHINKPSTTNNIPKLLLGIGIHKLESNITNLTVNNTFEFFWTINTNTLKLMEKIGISKMFSFFNGIEPLYTSKFKSTIYKTTGVKVPQLGYTKRSITTKLSKGGKNKMIKNKMIKNKKTKKLRK
jgi:hypothetical protein